MSTATQVLDVARSQLGVKEDPQGSNDVVFNTWFYGREVSGSTYPWCAVFVSWVANQAGATKVIPKHAYTPAGAQWFKDRNAWYTIPKVGDIVYYDIAGMGRISHTGIVEIVNSDGSWYAIEGNTDGGGSRTGGRVMRQRRSKVGQRGGFGRPAYGSVDAPQPQPQTPSAPAPAPAPSGDGGWPLPAGQYFGPSNARPSNDGTDNQAERNYVAEFQDQLSKLGYDIGKYGPDGQFGGDTANATRAWQRRVVATVDGGTNLGAFNVSDSGLCGLNDWQAIHDDRYRVGPGPVNVRPYPGAALRQSATGDGVLWVQQRLAAAVGLDYSSAPGTFGPRTVAAVQAFQRSRGIVDDGVVGAITWAELAKVSA